MRCQLCNAMLLLFALPAVQAIAVAPEETQPKFSGADELPAEPDAVGIIHEYVLAGTTHIPSYGNAQLELTVELTVVDRDESGVKLVQLLVPSAPLLTDRDGLLHALRRPFDVQTHAFYYRQAHDGHLVDVLHHPGEPWESLSMKRELASAHQLVGVPSTRRRLRTHRSSSSRDAARWKATEADAGGDGEARYHMHLRKAGWNVRKALVYREAEGCVQLAKHAILMFVFSP